MKLKDAVARIEELEKRIRDLEARPIFVPLPYPVPAYPQSPMWPQPYFGTPMPLPVVITDYTLPAIYDRV